MSRARIAAVAAVFVLAVIAAIALAVRRSELRAVREQQLRGRQLVDRYGCTSCHMLDGSPGIGPSFKGLYGRKTALTDGTTVVADEHYIEESIRKPDARIVKGYDPVMPVIDVPPADLHEIVKYIETLK